jgi:ABC-2 type transport system ATP-binding protein
VYLNGAILGMRRAEIEAKFERIVRFAEVADFIDTPIKYYSSGMMVRLGFSVAAHVDPEILLVDEVLAVGDLAFQAKCLNKLAELRDEDKTCILVSHAMPNILRHSDRVLWIDQGRVRRFGEPEAVVEEYLRSVQTRVAADGAPPSERPDSGIVIREVTIRNREGASAHVLQYGQPATVEVVYHIDRPVSDPVVAVTFEDVRGAALGGLTSRLDGAKLDTRREDGVARLILSPVVFTRGAYTVTVAILDENIQRYLDVRHAATTFMVEGPGVSSREVSGHVVYPHRWEIEAAEE